MKKLKALTSSKARDILGVGPITKDNIKQKMGMFNNYEKAKISAVQVFLRKQLMYDDNEISELRIMGMKVVKGNIIYIAVSEHEMIKDL